MKMHRRSTRTVSIAAAMVFSLLVSVPTLARADTGTPPVLQDIFGGPLHAEMYPSGLEVDSAGNIVIADTGNNQVAKYAPNGTQLWRIGDWGAGMNEFDNPRDIAIDASGNIYVMDTRNSRVVKLSSNGVWLDTYLGPVGDLMNFGLGVTVHGNILYVADTGRKKVRRIDVSGGGWNELPAVVADPDGGQFPDSGCRNLKGIRDADADSAGNVYVTGYLTNDIAKFDPSGNCVDWGVTGTGPGQFRTPYGVRVATDPVQGQEVLYVADGLNARVQEFTLTGTYLREFGVFGEPTVPGTVTASRRVAIATDGSGDAWIADLWGNRIERYDRGPGGYTYAQTIGAVLPPEDDTHVFQEPRQVVVGADGIVNVIDTVHHRFVRMDSTGHIVGICGERAAEGAELGKFNWPRGMAIDNATGQIWVADTKQNRLQIVQPDCTGLEFIGDFFGGAGTDQFNWPYGVAIRQSDRIAFVSDTENHRLKSFNVATRTQLAIFGAKGTGFSQFKRPAGIAVSPVTGNIFVADSENNRIKELSSTNGTSLTTVRNITGGFLNPEGVAIDAQGRIYVADSGNDRIVILDVNRVQIATLTADGMDYPSTVGIDAAGRIYVSDTHNDRVLVYAWQVPDTTLPTATMTVPAQNQVYQGLSPITFSGTAADNVGVTAARVAIKNIATNLWWRSNNTWGAYQLQPASLGTPGGTSTTWSYTWTPPMTGSFSVLVESADAAGNVAVPKPTRSFTVSNAPPDTTAPNGTVTTPSPGQVFPGLGAKAFSGTATDNVGVSSVQLAIKKGGSNLWWNGTAFVTGFRWFTTATLGSPGGTSTGWTFSWTPPATGPYGLQVRANDAAGNFDASQPFVNFSIT
jgi:DNA-binding beta-propeller fold protein YncE